MQITMLVSALGLLLSPQSAVDRAADDTAGTARTIYREVYDYEAAGRRDPFASLLGTGEIKPIITDLRVTSILFDPTGNSVAVLRDLTSREQYRVRPGQTIGRLRVVAIRQRSVTFAIEEFGYSRQETLTIGDSENTRMP
jgi:hypothetical protein